MIQLYENYKKLSDVIKEKAAASAGKKGKTQSKPPISLLSIKFVTKIMHFMIRLVNTNRFVDIPGHCTQNQE